MKKADYLKMQNTKDFIEYLVKIAKADSWSHQWWDNERKINWWCDSLLDAARKYQFPIGRDIWGKVISDWSPPEETLASNSRFLQSLQNRLRESRKKKDTGEAMAACELILQWGGVYERGSEKKNTNKAKLQNISEREGGLLGYLAKVDTELDKDDDDLTDACCTSGTELYCNAGFTKIYSLMRDDFVIYDSRVAAALGLLVRRYCEDKKKREVPPELGFMWMTSSMKKVDGKYKPNQCRDPSQGTLKFPYRQSGVDGHIRFFRCNIRANWLLSEIIKEASMKKWWDFANEQKITRLRAVEAALFMVGYDLCPPPPSKSSQEANS